MIPAATDYTSAPKEAGRAYRNPRLRIFRILPNATALSRSTLALKEHLGLLVYRLRGWA